MFVHRLVCIQNGVLVYRLGCWYTGWGVSIRDGALVYWMGWSYTGWGVSIRNGGVSCERSEPVTRVGWRISPVYIYIYKVQKTI